MAEHKLYANSRKLSVVRTKLNARRIVANGCAMSVGEWARESHLTSEVIYDRISAGWDESDAVTVKLGGKRPMHLAPFLTDSSLLPKAPPGRRS